MMQWAISEENAIGSITRYQYDGVGNLIGKQKPDGKNIIYAYTSRSQLARISYADGSEKRFTYDAAGQLVLMQRGATWEKQQYDAVGRIIATVDDKENRIGYAYDLVGNRTKMHHAGGTSSYRYDAELYHFHFRQYDASAGVWTTTDPIGILGGLNLYGYVQNNPLKYRDILGLGRDPDEVYFGLPSPFAEVA